MPRSDLARLLELEGDLRLDPLESPALRGNPLGDPSERLLAIYLPPGYDDNRGRYPVIYVMHGYTGDVAALVAGAKWERNVVQRADALIQNGALAPTIVVIVDGWTRLGGSQYVDSIHNGAYATYATRDVIDYIDSHYRTLAREGGRAVVGKSSGGFAALHLTMTRPGIYCAFASHSGDTGFGQTMVPSFANAQRELEKAGNDIARFVANFEAKNKRSAAEFSTIEMLGYSAAYSPRAAEAFAFDVPWDLQTGEVRPEVMARWREYDPVEVCTARKDELERLRLRYVDCGRRDEYGLDVGARMLVKRMREMGLDVRHEEFDDDHRKVGYRYDISLPALGAVLDR